MCNLHKMSLRLSLLLRSLLFVAGCLCLFTSSACASSVQRKLEMRDVAGIWRDAPSLTTGRQGVASATAYRFDLLQDASSGFEDGYFEQLFCNSSGETNNLFPLSIRVYHINSQIARHAGIYHLPLYLLFKKPKLYISI